MYSVYASPLGPLTIDFDGALRGLWMEGQANFPADIAQIHAAPATGFVAAPGPVADWLDAYFAGENPAVTFEVAPEGTPFQQAVWSALRDIPYATTTTYAALASVVGKRLNRTTSARAIGGAVGRNPVMLVAPCHRVLASDGTLAGFSAGLERKAWLLDHERGAGHGRSGTGDPGTAAT
ncbi:methylated-DNA--[protein]-cysteine S-methyltransferase [Trueperella pecoris]|uniref:methylated-DNA--[protein]-cysteine S-methyltransferase n=1 Tax=Trueperella pecoris TaxID=2733571 RepID=A0A7M1R0A9_9ACTO|nr:methylated-DNA--[protein]-cysteine S-methyltransferase [Trueperella pecoris]QOR47772.1 methylated-DNA--[protein]-cysteine S-methyltransferase [Trueperella pecoris]